MLSEELRARLAALPRATPLLRAAERAKLASDLESLVPGQVCLGAAGSFYLVRQSVACSNSTLTKLADSHTRFAAAWEGEAPELDSFVRAFPRGTVFLDLETCGFSGAPLFLIGVLRHADGELWVEQFLARDYTEEPAVLAHLWTALADAEVLVSFNGKSFDWPFVLDRSMVHGLVRRGRGRGPSQRWVHCDLLPLARRAWKRPLGLPNCKLKTLEAVLCGRYRSGDTPGYLIPAAYHAFVRTGDARQLARVLEHNSMDLITLAHLALLLTRRMTRPADECWQDLGPERTWSPLSLVPVAC